MLGEFTAEKELCLDSHKVNPLNDDSRLFNFVKAIWLFFTNSAKSH